MVNAAEIPLPPRQQSKNINQILSFALDLEWAAPRLSTICGRPICTEFELQRRPVLYWKGYLKLSLVASPDFGVHGDHELGSVVSFRQINKQTGNRLRQQLVDDVTRDVVEAADKGRGYEVDKGVYIQIEDEEIESLEIESSHTIDIDRFVPRGQIDERYFDSTYYVTPNDEVGQEAFAVIREAMRGKQMVALGRVVLAKRERVIALQPVGQGRAWHHAKLSKRELRNAGEYFDEIPDTKIPKDMLQLAEHILESKAGATLDPSTFIDHYEEAVVEMSPAQAGRHAGGEAEGRGAGVERHQPDGCASQKRRRREGLCQIRRPRAKKGKKGKQARGRCRHSPQFKFPIEGGKAKQPKVAAAPKLVAAPCRRRARSGSRRSRHSLAQGTWAIELRAFAHPTLQQFRQRVQRRVHRRRDAEPRALAHHVTVEMVDLGRPALCDILRSR